MKYRIYKEEEREIDECGVDEQEDQRIEKLYISSIVVNLKLYELLVVTTINILMRNSNKDITY